MRRAFGMRFVLVSRALVSWTRTHDSQSRVRNLERRKAMKAVKVFFACAFGATIGTMIALQVNHNVWWLGLAVGFVTGYLSYEFKAVITAVPRAWKAAVAWTPDRKAWSTYGR